MSVVDLRSRVTIHWNEFNQCLRSSDSLIYVEGPVILEDDDPASMDLSIGDRWFSHRDNTFYLIPNEGLHLESHQAIVVETKQLIAMPLNVFGLVTGKGKYIFQGMFVSAGKIDPCFHGKLKIGFYNGSGHTIVLKTGDVFCSCCFLQMETNLDIPLRLYDPGPTLAPSPQSFRSRIANWISANKLVAFNILIAVLTMIAAVITLYAAILTIK